jgi:acetyl esterase/lipase
LRLTLRAIVALAILAVPSFASGQPRVERDIVYGMHSGTALLLDIHYPSVPNGLAIVFVPGSGWTANPAVSMPGRKIVAPEFGDVGLKDLGDQVPIWVPPLTTAGYTLFVINHRATPGFHYPAPLQDVQRAIRFVRYHASTYRIDAARIGAMGGSSGGHLIALTATLDGGGREDDPDPINQLSAKVQAAVLRAAPTDLTTFRSNVALPALFGLASFPAKVAKTSPLGKRLADASPLMHVSPDDPPMLLICGDADDIYQQNVTFVAALQTHRVPSRLLTIPGGIHGPAFVPMPAPGRAVVAVRLPQWPDYLAQTVQWFDEHLRNSKSTNCPPSRGMCGKSP